MAPARRNSAHSALFHQCSIYARRLVPKIGAWRNKMSNVQEVWWRPEPVRARSDQAALAANRVNGRSIPYNFRRPAVGLVTIKYYPFLIEDRTLYIGGLASIVFLVSGQLRHVWQRVVSARHAAIFSSCSSGPALVCV
jgi:hypothetical protein